MLLCSILRVLPVGASHDWETFYSYYVPSIESDIYGLEDSVYEEEEEEEEKPQRRKRLRGAKARAQAKRKNEPEEIHEEEPEEGRNTIPRPVIGQLIRALGFETMGKEMIDPEQILPSDYMNPIAGPLMSQDGSYNPRINATRDLINAVGKLSSIPQEGIGETFNSITPWFHEINRIQKIRHYYNEPPSI